MADISKITLPSNVTYDLKDTTARSGLANKQDKITAITAQTTQAVYPIKIDSQGHITEYGSAVTIPAAVTESTVSGWGFTKNAGTITGINMNGASKGTSGVVDLGTVITSHQDISGKVNKSGDTMTGDLKLHREGTTANNYPSKLIFENKDTTTGQTYNNAYVAAYNDHASATYGTNMVIHSGGGMFIGSGESPANHYSAKGTSYTGEDTFVTADNNLYLQGSGNDINNRKGFVVNTSGELVPIVKDVATNNSGGIGNSSTKIANGYFTNINGVAVGTSPKFTDTTYGADRGISNVSGNFGHSNTAITAQTTQAVYPIKIDAYGHITGYGSAVTIPAAVAVKGNSESTYRTGNVNLTAANIGAAASSHSHGDITSGGDITTTATIAAGDRLVINDESASKITNSSITFGASTTNYLRNDGTWNIPEKGTLIYNRTSSSATKHTVLNFTTIASGSGNSVDMMTTIDILWINASPGSSFSEQDVSVNASNYRFLLIIFRLATDGRITSQMCKVDESMGWSMGQVNPGSNCLVRRNYQVFSGHIHFNNAANSGTYANSSSATSYLVPLYIYGIK